MRRLHSPPSVPLVVLQWDSLIAVNYPARKYGITRMCRLGEARRMCPGLRVVHTKVFRDGEGVPRYWDWERGEIDSRRDKVRRGFYFLLFFFGMCLEFMSSFCP